MARLMIGKDPPVCEHGAAKEGGEVRLRLAGLSHAADDPFGTDLRDLEPKCTRARSWGCGRFRQRPAGAALRAPGEAPLSEKFPVQIMGFEVGGRRPGGGGARACFARRAPWRGAVPRCRSRTTRSLRRRRTAGSCGAR
jgi:simple sugar transport system ATP-binding protein